MDAGCDPRVREVVIIQAAQLGATQLLLTIAGSSIDLDPSPLLWVNTTIGESETVSKDRFEACHRDNPVVAERIPPPKARDGENTVLDKRFPGGRLLFRGTNAPAGLRSHPIRVRLMDEVDGDPATTAGGRADRARAEAHRGVLEPPDRQVLDPGRRRDLAPRARLRGQRQARLQGPLPGPRLRPRADAALVAGALGQG
jgi:phage terminase large subunit GpA